MAPLSHHDVHSPRLELVTCISRLRSRGLVIYRVVSKRSSAGSDPLADSGLQTELRARYRGSPQRSSAPAVTGDAARQHRPGTAG